MPRIDEATEIGKRYGKLTVIEAAPPITVIQNGKAHLSSAVRCRCDCGKMVVIRIAKLHARDRKSCRECGVKISQHNRRVNSLAYLFRR